MIAITPEARTWLDQKKRDVVTLERQVAKLNACCATTLAYMDVYFHIPDSPANFQSETVDGITVYYPKTIKLPADRDVVIELQSTLGIKSLKVEGLMQRSDTNR